MTPIQPMHPAQPGEPEIRPEDDAPERGTDVIYLAAGCFWGVEEIMWERPDVLTTAVGYMGGSAENPTYEQVCTGTTGHAETVRVEYDPAVTDVADILQEFWESHDPTTVDRQGNDIGTQYRSAVFVTNDTQLNEAMATREIYQDALNEAGLGAIVTEILPANEAGPFYFAEEYHQQYLMKNPNGYRCHAKTGVPFPDINEK
ncbi:MAG TPA: peptide-methionine (S)-S-oxide reductase MsrA [Actinomycetales bacterium]|nr:peptide-methionine (S)-S-oxide reductase MsrA [Actinomycetales bacterium]